MAGINMNELSPTHPCDVFWGNDSFAIKVCEAPANMAISAAFEWFKENSHYFHMDRFPPYSRVLTFPGFLWVDYGSHAHFLYVIPK